LWKTDGTPSGTGLIKQINSVGSGSFPNFLNVLDSQLVFTAINEQGVQGVWSNQASPTLIGAKNIMNFPPNDSGATRIIDMKSHGKTTYFLVKDKDAIHSTFSGSTYYDAALWKTDGTTAGTTLVLKADGTKIFGTKLIASGSSVYLQGLNDLYQMSQATPNPVVLPTRGTMSQLGQVFESKNNTFFTQSINFREKLFVIKNNAALSIESTALDASAVHSSPVDVNGIVYFIATNASVTQLWKTDGTSAGTVRVKSFEQPGTAVTLQNLTSVNTVLYFTLTDLGPPDGLAPLPRQLWSSDGTEAGTTLLSDSVINKVSQFANLMGVNSKLFFTAYDADHGQELWTSNGTAAGTQLVKDIHTTGSSLPVELTNANGFLYFAANDGVHGQELWSSDGTSVGTTLVQDLQPGISGSSPHSITFLNSQIYFSATTQAFGQEVWYATIPPNVIPPNVIPPNVIPPNVIPPNVIPPNVDPPSTKPSNRLNLVGVPLVAVGSDAGAGVVRFLNPDRTERFSIMPFTGFTGGVRTASADFNGDGIADLVVGSGPGIATRVKILNGVDQSVLFDLAPFEAAFTGGVFVAVGDINGDGKPDLLISPDEGGGPRVRIFSGVGFTQIADYFGIDDSAFRGGVRISVGDMDGDGMGEVIVAAGFGGGPRVTVWRGSVVAQGGSTPADAAIANFFAFETTLRNGAYIASGDFDGDGKADLAFGGGPGGGPRVRIFDGTGILAANGNFSNLDELPASQRANFFSGDVNNRGGIRLAVKDLDNDAKADLLTGSGIGGGAKVIGYAGKDLAKELFSFDAIASFNNGVYVG
jgi:ELWxxDGT repeat protein